MYSTILHRVANFFRKCQIIQSDTERKLAHIGSSSICAGPRITGSFLSDDSVLNLRQRLNSSILRHFRLSLLPQRSAPLDDLLDLIFEKSVTALGEPVRLLFQLGSYQSQKNLYDRLIPLRADRASHIDAKVVGIWAADARLIEITDLGCGWRLVHAKFIVLSDLERVLNDVADYFLTIDKLAHLLG